MFVMIIVVVLIMIIVVMLIMILIMVTLSKNPATLSAFPTFKFKLIF